LGGGLTVLVLPMPGTLASPEPSMPSFLTDMQERSMTKAERQKLRRRQLTDLFEQLDSLVPGQGDQFNRPRVAAVGSKRTIEELLRAVCDAVSALRMPGVMQTQAAHEKPTHRAALESHTQFGLICLDLHTAEIRHVSKELQEYCSWLDSESIEGHIFRYILHTDDVPTMREFKMKLRTDVCNGEDCSGRSICVRLLRKPRDERWQRVPPWLLVYTEPIRLVVVEIGRNMDGKKRDREEDGKEEESGDSGEQIVFVADLAVPQPRDVGVQAAHLRNMVDLGLFNQEYDLKWDQAGLDPLKYVMMYRYGPNPGRSSFFSSIVPALRMAAAEAAGWLLRTTVTGKFITCLTRDDETDAIKLSQAIKFTLAGGGTFRGTREITLGSRQDCFAEVSHGGNSKSQDVVYYVVDTKEPLSTVFRNVYLSFYGRKGAGVLYRRGWWSPHKMEINGEVPWSNNPCHRIRIFGEAVRKPGELEISVDEVANAFKELFTGPGKDKVVDGSEGVHYVLS